MIRSLDLVRTAPTRSMRPPVPLILPERACPGNQPPGERLAGRFRLTLPATGLDRTVQGGRPKTGPAASLGGSGARGLTIIPEATQTMKLPGVRTILAIPGASDFALARGVHWAADLAPARTPATGTQSTDRRDHVRDLALSGCLLVFGLARPLGGRNRRPGTDSPVFRPVECRSQADSSRPRRGRRNAAEPLPRATTVPRGDDRELADAAPTSARPPHGRSDVTPPAKADDGTQYFTLDELKDEMKKLAWTKGDFTIVPYGFLWGNMVYETERTDPRATTSLYVLPPAPTPRRAVPSWTPSRRGWGSTSPGRGSRFLAAPRAAARWKSTSSGLFDTENKAGVLLRHAYCRGQERRVPPAGRPDVGRDLAVVSRHVDVLGGLGRRQHRLSPGPVPRRALPGLLRRVAGHGPRLARYATSRPTTAHPAWSATIPVGR